MIEWNDVDNVKSVKECIEMATMDAYDEDELLSGWNCCFDDLFSDIQKVKLFGEEVNFGGIDFEHNSLVAICEKGRKKIKVSLDSVELIEPSKAQKLWLKAWIE